MDEAPTDGERWMHREAVVNDVRLHYVAAGDSGDPLVVLLHGFPEFWYSWRRQLPALAAAGYRVVAPDMRGYNISEKPRGVSAYALPELVEDVVGIVDHCGDGPAAAVVGHDWGGMVAWETATAHPELVERVAVLNAPHPRTFPRELARPRQAARSWYAFLVQLPWLPEVLFDRVSGVEPALCGASATPDVFSRADLRRYREAFERPGAIRASLNYYRAEGRRVLRQTARDLRSGGGSSVALSPDLPVLVLWGERDPALDPRISDRLPVLGRGVRVVRFPAVGHFVQNEAPVEVTERLLAFLGEPPEPR
jgi:pimeloyl-ACP methyl ester carboxylesterase